MLQPSHLVADGDEHVTEFDQASPVADGTVTRNHDGLGGGFRKVCFCGANHGVDAAAGIVVNEREIAVPPGIPNMQNIGSGEVNRNIGVRMSRAVVIKSDVCAIELQPAISREYLCRQ